MKNKDMVFLFCIAIILGIMYAISRAFPANTIQNTMPPKPINLYTNGVANGNTNDVANRVNFGLQPT